MPLWGYEIKEREMYEPILRLFERTYQRGYGDTETYVKRSHARHDDITDVLYYRSYNQIHIVEAKRMVRDIYDALYKLKRYRGNYKYLALPDGEYYEDMDFVDDIIRYCVGLILVGRRGYGLYAYWYYNPPYYSGDFSRYY